MLRAFCIDHLVFVEATTKIDQCEGSSQGDCEDHEQSWPSLSLDGYGAGPDQSLENPLGVNGMDLHQWASPATVC